MSITLTPADSKQARVKLNLSQTKAAAEAGINRAYLSQFENGSRILTDNTLNQLLDYYLSQGWADTNDPIEDEIAIQKGIIRVCDGFVIPDTTEDEVVDHLLAEYHQNETEIAKLQKQESEQGFFLGLDEDATRSKSQRLILLMARNYGIVTQLHGQETLLPTFKERTDINTLGDLVKNLFHEENAGHMGQYI